MQKATHEIHKDAAILVNLGTEEKPQLGLPIIHSTDSTTWVVCCNIYLAGTQVTDMSIVQQILTDIDLKDVKVEVFTRRTTKTGKLINSDSVVLTAGANQGKKNETTALQVAIVKMQALYRAKYKKKQLITTTSSTYPFTEIPKINPMLLGLYKYQSKSQQRQIDFPCFMQRKYDGLRCVAVVRKYSSACVEVALQSRGQCEYTNLNHISQFIQTLCSKVDIPDNQVFFLDGELYSHGLTLQKINSLIKNQSCDTSAIQLRVFDCAFYGPAQSQEMKFADRLSIIQSLEITNPDAPVFAVPTTLVQEEEVETYMNQFLQEGYEGAVLREINSPYVFSVNSKRSTTTLKYKKRDDLEVKVVSYTCGQARDQDAIVFICEYNGHQFNVVQNQTLDIRKKQFLYLQDNKHLLSALNAIPLTIEYSGLSETGVPQQPRGIVFRFDLVSGVDQEGLLLLKNYFL